MYPAVFNLFGSSIIVASFPAGTLGIPEHLAGVNPNLDADPSVGRVRLGEAVVDVRADGLQRDGALMVMFGSGDLGAAQASGNRNLMPLAPNFIARPMACFIARRNETRASSCEAIDSATSCAFCRAA